MRQCIRVMLRITTPGWIQAHGPKLYSVLGMKKDLEESVGAMAACSCVTPPEDTCNNAGLGLGLGQSVESFVRTRKASVGMKKGQHPSLHGVSTVRVGEVHVRPHKHDRHPVLALWPHVHYACVLSDAVGLLLCVHADQTKTQVVMRY